MFGRGEAPVDFRVEGAEQLAQVAKRMRQAGTSGGGLRKELMQGIRKTVPPIRNATRKSWRGLAPAAGGLNRQGLRMTVQTNTRNGGKLGVRLITRSAQGYDMGQIDLGKLRHPVFGRNVWVDQRIDPGIITDAQEKSAPDVRREIVRVIENIARKVEG